MALLVCRCPVPAHNVSPPLWNRWLRVYTLCDYFSKIVLLKDRESLFRRVVPNAARRSSFFSRAPTLSSSSWEKEHVSQMSVGSKGRRTELFIISCCRAVGQTAPLSACSLVVSKYVTHSLRVLCLSCGALKRRQWGKRERRRRTRQPQLCVCVCVCLSKRERETVCVPLACGSADLS